MLFSSTPVICRQCLYGRSIRLAQSSQVHGFHTSRASLRAKNHYEALGVPRRATEKEIKSRYYALARELHPDAGNKAESERFTEVSEAYKILSDRHARALYDYEMTATPSHGNLWDYHKASRQAYGDSGTGPADPRWFYRDKEAPAGMRGSDVLNNGLVMMIIFCIVGVGFGFQFSRATYLSAMSNEVIEKVHRKTRADLIKSRGWGRANGWQAQLSHLRHLHDDIEEDETELASPHEAK
eukprot:Clim_evm72s33 gene=Clim_evmTU72s33